MAKSTQTPLTRAAQVMNACIDTPVDDDEAGTAAWRNPTSEAIMGSERLSRLAALGVPYGPCLGGNAGNFYQSTRRKGK
jgi:hypothetical protein